MLEELATTICAVLGAATLIQISPLKLNPWSLVGKLLRGAWRAFCRSLNADVLAEIKQLKADLSTTKTDLADHIHDADYEKATRWRAKIISFSDELRIGTGHSEEMFDEVLRTIDSYEEFCRLHDDYPNSKAVTAIRRVRENYADRLLNNDFL